MKSKRLLSSIIAACLLCLFVSAILSGCGSQPRSEGISVVCTIFPEYDWVREISSGIEDGPELTLLLDSGTDLHSYQPTADDIIKISTCDIFIYVGGESDAWANDALRQARNKNMTVIKLLELLGDRAHDEELKEGMQSGEEDGEEETEKDEHVWLSLKNAAFLCREIAEALAKADPSHAEEYKSNAGSYIEKLERLDGEYTAAVSQAARRTLLFADRFPFRYLTEDYGLDYYAAFSGCSAESEASFETVTFLARKADELALPAIIKLESSDGKIAQTVVQSAANENLKILTMDSMQSAGIGEVRSGVTYLSVMENNLAVLKEALDAK